MEIISSINRLLWMLSISLCLSLPIKAQLYQEVILEDIEFGPDQAIIENDSSAHLQALVDLLNKYPDFNVKIAGHSDEDEKSADLIDLSIKGQRPSRKPSLAMTLVPTGSKPLVMVPTDPSDRRNSKADRYPTGG